MKRCESCKFRHTYEWEKPCMGYREGCQLYQKGEDMTREEAIKELSEMRTDAWTDSRQMEALDMAIKALEQEPKMLDTIDFAIDASNGETNYFVGFRNGLRYAKSLIDGEDPQYESCTEQEPRGEMLICPECGLDVHSDFKTCPRCGCRMIEPQDKNIIWYDKRNYSEIVVKPQESEVNNG